jgi:TPR repeat protein
LQFLYLRRSAEEGFVHAQHELAQAYRRGELVKRDDYRALAWYRECIRNGGSPASYIEAAEILLESDQVAKNRLFAFANYFGAYQKGALFLEPVMKQLSKEIEEVEGLTMPKIVYIDPSKFNH